ncbi:MAG TPA: hypothetical protein VHE35_20290 [Kofleriaceae bacterium]|nr:hypothetical protein [Kofleriaceae bacterium]
MAAWLPRWAWWTVAALASSATIVLVVRRLLDRVLTRTSGG